VQDGIKDECVAFMPSLRDALLGVLTKACEDKSLSAAQMKDLLKLASSSARQTKRLCTPEQLSTTWTPSAWNQLRVQLAASDRFKSSTALLNACKQLAQLTGAPAAAPHTNGVKTAAAPPTEATESADPQPKKASKRKAEQTKGAQAEGSPEKAKRKKSKKA
jgi:DNA polymerase phi